MTEVIFLLLSQALKVEQTHEYLDRFMASQTVGRYVVNVRGSFLWFYNWVFR